MTSRRPVCNTAASVRVTRGQQQDDSPTHPDAYYINPIIDPMTVLPLGYPMILDASPSGWHFSPESASTRGIMEAARLLATPPSSMMAPFDLKSTQYGEYSDGIRVLLVGMSRPSAHYQTEALSTMEAHMASYAADPDEFDCDEFHRQFAHRRFEDDNRINSLRYLFPHFLMTSVNSQHSFFDCAPISITRYAHIQAEFTAASARTNFAMDEHAHIKHSPPPDDFPFAHSPATDETVVTASHSSTQQASSSTSSSSITFSSPFDTESSLSFAHGRLFDPARDGADSTIFAHRIDRPQEFNPDPSRLSDEQYRVYCMIGTNSTISDAEKVRRFDYHLACEKAGNDATTSEPSAAVSLAAVPSSRPPRRGRACAVPTIAYRLIMLDHLRNGDGYLTFLCEVVPELMALKRIDYSTAIYVPNSNGLLAIVARRLNRLSITFDFGRKVDEHPLVIATEHVEQFCEDADGMGKMAKNEKALASLGKGRPFISITHLVRKFRPRIAFKRPITEVDQPAARPALDHEVDQPKFSSSSESAADGGTPITLKEFTMNLQQSVRQLDADYAANSLAEESLDSAMVDVAPAFDVSASTAEDACTELWIMREKVGAMMIDFMSVWKYERDAMLKYDVDTVVNSLLLTACMPMSSHPIMSGHVSSFRHALLKRVRDRPEMKDISQIRRRDFDVDHAVRDTPIRNFSFSYVKNLESLIRIMSARINQPKVTSWMDGTERMTYVDVTNFISATTAIMVDNWLATCDDSSQHAAFILSLEKFVELFTLCTPTDPLYRPLGDTKFLSVTTALMYLATHIVYVQSVYSSKSPTVIVALEPVCQFLLAYVNVAASALVTTYAGRPKVNQSELMAECISVFLESPIHRNMRKDGRNMCVWYWENAILNNATRYPSTFAQLSIGGKIRPYDITSMNHFISTLAHVYVAIERRVHRPSTRIVHPCESSSSAPPSGIDEDASTPIDEPSTPILVDDSASNDAAAAPIDQLIRSMSIAAS